MCNPQFNKPYAFYHFCAVSIAGSRTISILLRSYTMYSSRKNTEWFQNKILHKDIDTPGVCCTENLDRQIDIDYFSLIDYSRNYLMVYTKINRLHQCIKY